MNPRGIFSFLFGLILVGVLVSIGVGVYQAGINQGIIQAGRFPAGAEVPVAGPGWQGPDFLGILFGIFILFLLFGLIRAAFWRGPGWGHHGYGWGSGWDRGSGSGGARFEGWREERERRIADLHRRLHEEGDAGTSGSAAASGPAGTPAR